MRAERPRFGKPHPPPFTSPIQSRQRHNLARLPRIGILVVRTYLLDSEVGEMIRVLVLFPQAALQNLPGQFLAA